MKIEELRIGNWVTYMNKHNERIHSLEEKDHWKDTDKINGFSIDIYDPIPLTEEKLLKCGFENKGNVKQFDADNFHNAVIYRTNDYTEVLYGKPCDTCEIGFYYIVETYYDDYGLNYISTKINSLHDLQNVYYYNNNKTELNVEL